MSFNPFFDVSDLTLEQLIDKQQEVFAKMTTAQKAGANGMILERFHDMANTIQMRMQELMIEQRHKEDQAKQQTKEVSENGNDDTDASTINIG